MSSNIFFFENRTVYEIKNVVERSRPYVTIWRMRMRIACWMSKATDIHILRLCNTHCFPTATIVARTRLNVTLYVHGLSSLVLGVLRAIRGGFLVLD